MCLSNVYLWLDCSCGSTLTQRYRGLNKTVLERLKPLPRSRDGPLTFTDAQSESDLLVYRTSVTARTFICRPQSVVFLTPTPQPSPKSISQMSPTLRSGPVEEARRVSSAHTAIYPARVQRQGIAEAQQFTPATCHMHNSHLQNPAIYSFFISSFASSSSLITSPTSRGSPLTWAYQCRSSCQAAWSSRWA